MSAQLLDICENPAQSVPKWWLELYRQIKAKRYTGPITLDCREGSIAKITQTQTRTVTEFRLLCSND